MSWILLFVVAEVNRFDHTFLNNVSCLTLCVLCLLFYHSCNFRIFKLLWIERPKRMDQWHQHCHGIQQNNNIVDDRLVKTMDTMMWEGGDDDEIYDIIKKYLNFCWWKRRRKEKRKIFYYAHNSRHFIQSTEDCGELTD